MSLTKVIEVKAEGKTREEAVKNAVKKASEINYNIKSVYVGNISGVVEANKITKYRLSARIAVLLN
jgi:flavin-binding protein dodecin